MRKLIILLASFVLAASAHSAQPTTKSVDALLKAMNAKKTIESLFDTLEPMMKQTLDKSMKDQELTPQQQQFIYSMPAKFTEIMREEMSWANMRPLYVQIYQESFTQKEIDGLVAFYKGPAGKAFVSKMPVVMQKTMSIMQNRLGPLMERMSAAMKEALEEAKSAK